MLLKNLSIGRRLAIGFLVVVLAMITVTAVGVTRVEQIQTRLSTINDLNSVKQRYAINFRGSVHDRAIALRDVVLAGSPADVDREVALIESLEADYADSAVLMAEVFADPANVGEKEVEALAQIERIEAETMPLVDEVVGLQRAGEGEAALALLTEEAKPRFVEWLAAINVLIDLEESMNQAESAQARSIAGSFLMTMVLLAALAALAASVVAWRLTRGITRPLAAAVDVLAHVADGDLTQRLDVTSNDEVGRLARSLNTALAAVGGALGSVAGSTQGLSALSGRIGELSGRIAEGAQESAAQADVVASAANEVSSNVHAVASGSEQMGASIREIAQSANEAAGVAQRAVDVVEITSATVSRLGDSSREIDAVVKTITTIAEQTNLLALNATIEAARAGEAGKGFAVVAGEVKELSQETARATEDISRRVEAIQADTRSAVAAIAEVASVIARMNDHQMTVASAVEEQNATTTEMNRGVAEAAAGSEQIAANITRVADVARATTDSVAESQRAADELASVSEELRGLVQQFRF